MTINLRLRTIEPTDAIKAYAEQKFSDLGNFGEAVRHLDVEVGKESTHHKSGDVFTCRAVLEMEGGDALRMDREAADLYKAIDKVRDLLREELGERHRAKRPAALEEGV